MFCVFCSTQKCNVKYINSIESTFLQILFVQFDLKVDISLKELNEILSF